MAFVSTPTVVPTRMKGSARKPVGSLSASLCHICQLALAYLQGAPVGAPVSAHGLG